MMSRMLQNQNHITFYLFWDFKQGSIKGTCEKSNVRLQQTIFQLTGDAIKDEPKYLRGLNSAQHTKRFRKIIAFKCILQCVLRHAIHVQCFYLHSKICLHKKGIDANYLGGAS